MKGDIMKVKLNTKRLLKLITKKENEKMVIEKFKKKGGEK